MLDFHSKLFRGLVAIAALVFVIFTNVFISFGTSCAVMFQALSAGLNKYCSLGLAILVAIAIFLFIRWNHKIWEFIHKQGTKDNE